MEKTFDEKLAEARAAVPSISADEANAIWQQRAAVFIDPRDADDIPGTAMIPSSLNIHLQALQEKAIEQLPAELQDTDRRVVTACGMGPMGALAAHSLKNRGYRNVSFVEGGIQGWVEAGYPVR